MITAPLLLLFAAPDAALVYVEPSTVTSTTTFTDALEAEIRPGRVVASSTSATHRVRVDAVADTLLVAVERSNQLVLARTIPNDDPRASRRVAVLLIARAVREAPVIAKTAPPRPRAPPPPLGPTLSIAPQAVLVGWARPVAVPQLGLQVDVGYLEDGLGGGLSVAVAGGLCCSRSTADVEGTAVEIHAILEGRVPLLEAGGARFGLDAGVGVAGYFMSVRPVFSTSSSRGTAFLERNVELVLRAGVGAWVPLSDTWAFVARVAVRASIVGQRVLRPTEFPTDEPFGPGPIGPWLSAGVEWALF